MSAGTECFVGIDLGSTTTKSVIMDATGRVIGRGITNSRSNYTVACQVARSEAETSARFGFLADALRASSEVRGRAGELLGVLSARFALAQFRRQLAALREDCLAAADAFPRAGAPGDSPFAYREAIERIFADLSASSESLFEAGEKGRSDFFRDLAASLYLKRAEEISRESGLSFDRLIGMFDRAILKVENRSFADSFGDYLGAAGRETAARAPFSEMKGAISAAVDIAAQARFEDRNTVGTGYGRLTLPFPKEQIRSEILCHGLGAHAMFPGTRTVLDIGGQDTKAIQVDPNGIVTGFQMNDRCAAGCGRYLGYIADEMNMGVHQLGPLAMQAKRRVKINSTCTVFAGAELRERLAMGEKREDILGGLHRAIILRAMSLLARSGGVTSELTFTGGVARNEAAVAALRELVAENYGGIQMNISEGSIYTGAMGAGLFAMRG